MQRFILTALLVLSPFCGASYGEMDLVVRESIENHFRDYNKSVDLQTLEYRGQPKQHEDVITINSSVWAEQHMIKPYWGWHDCTTRIQVAARGYFVDLGSNCYFDFD